MIQSLLMLREKINLGIVRERFFKKILDKESIIRYSYNPLSKG